MATRPTASLTPLELEIMKALWELGPASLQAVHARVARERDLAYTTVQTMLTVLHRKGKVARELRQRAYVYRAVLSRESVARSALAGMIRNLFGGSAASLVMSMVESEQIDAATLARIQKMLRGGKA